MALTAQSQSVTAALKTPGPSGRSQPELGQDTEIHKTLGEVGHAAGPVSSGICPSHWDCLFLKP